MTRSSAKSAPKSRKPSTPILGVLKLPGEKARTVKFVPSLEAIRDLIGGNVEGFPAPIDTPGVWLIAGEDSLKGLEPNHRSYGVMIVGPLLWISRSDEGLTAKEAKAAIEWFDRKEPDQAVNDDSFEQLFGSIE